jgi:hypothetical protein
MSIPFMLLLPSVKHSYNTELVMSTPVIGFENQTPNLSIMYLISAERDVLRPTNNKSKEMKRGLKDDEVVKPSKKQKTKR